MYLLRWTIDLRGAENTLYAGERYQLKFKFSDRYPFDSPQVSYILSHCQSVTYIGRLY